MRAIENRHDLETELTKTGAGKDELQRVIS